MRLSSLSLDKDWSFTQVGGGQGTEDGEWIPVSNFPTTVHVELLKLGKIPDPVSRFIYFAARISPVLRIRLMKTIRMVQFVGLNEWEVQCKFRTRRLGI